MGAVLRAGEIPAIGFVAPSGSGKTTLLRKLVPLLRQRGLRIGYLKHAHHGFALDRPGKDSYEIAAAGARQVMLVSGAHWALLSRTNEPAEDHPGGFDALRARFDAQGLDLLLIEGFRSAAVPKIEVFRAATGKAPLYPDDEAICAVVTDDPLPIAPHPNVLPLGDPLALADFIGQLVRERAGLLADGLFADPRAELIASLQRLQVGGAQDLVIGSASVRRGHQFWITPDGALGQAVVPDDLVACLLDDQAPSDASLDAALHGQVYRHRPESGALFHTHGPYSVALSVGGHDLVPLDDEGARLLGEVPVLSCGPDRHRPPASEQLTEAFAAHPACILAHRGAYAVGATIREAAWRAITLERSARISLLAGAALAR
ncbi:molybdopterin-guanine dinucleotide biosynthesis protein B [Halochromatium sp.]